MLTDIHHHLVFGVDDGADYPDESLRMLRIAAEQGIKRIVCSSHDAPGERPLNRKVYLDHLAELREMTKREGLPITLFSGSEILYTPETPQMIETGQALSIANGYWLLVEFLPDMPWTLMYGAVQTMRSMGFGIVIAHVERYTCLREVPQRIGDLRGIGDVLIQMNADTVLRSASVLNGRWTRHVLRAGMIDAVASDAHGSRFRTCRLGEAHAFLSRKYSAEMADQLCKKTPERLTQNDGDKTTV